MNTNKNSNKTQGNIIIIIIVTMTIIMMIIILMRQSIQEMRGIILKTFPLRAEIKATASGNAQSH
jgi:hypothetical protein